MSPSSSTGEDPQGDCISPFIAKSRNRSTPLSISQRISSCALPKTEPAGDALQSTALRLANDDDDDDDDDDDQFSDNHNSSGKYLRAKKTIHIFFSSLFTLV